MVKKIEEQKWISSWKRAAVALEAVHDAELEKLDTREALLNLEAAFRQSLIGHQPSSTSGLVEMRRYMDKARKW